MSLNNKSKLELLNKQREDLHKKYRAVVIKKVAANDEYNRMLSTISDEIHGVDAEIRILRTPVFVEDL